MPIKSVSSLHVFSCGPFQLVHVVLGLFCCFVLTSCAPNKDREWLASTHSYEALNKAMVKEQEDLKAARAKDQTTLESVSKPAPPHLEPEVPQYNPLEETRISISVRNEPLNDVLFVVVRNAGLDLVIDPQLSLENRVTISFENALSSEVVRSLLAAFDVHWYVRDNVLTVERFEERAFNLEFMNAKSEVTIETGGDIFGSSSAEESSNDLRGTFQVSSSQGKGMEEGSVYAGLQQNLESVLAGPEGAMGLFSINPVSGLLYVQTSPKRMKVVSTLVDRLRGKFSKQVMIDAQILEVVLSDGFNLGVDWNIVQQRIYDGRTYNYGVGVNKDTGMGTRGTPGSDLTALVLGTPTTAVVENAMDTIFQATINALQTFGGVKVVSNPHVRARHSMPALVTTGTTKNYIKEITRETNSDDNTVSITTDTASAFEGVMLGVVPFINDDSSVDLDVFPITSQVDLSNEKSFADGTTVTLPVVDVRNVSTNVRTRDGDTVILGGLIYKTSTKNDNAVPGLSDVPGLGWLFNTREDAEETRELVIVMHIRVVG